MAPCECIVPVFDKFPMIAKAEHIYPSCIFFIYHTAKAAKFQARPVQSLPKDLQIFLLQFM